MMILISSENKVPNYEVDDAGHHKILFTQKLQSFSSGTGTLLSGLVCNVCICSVMNRKYINAVFNVILCCNKRVLIIRLQSYLGIWAYVIPLPPPR